MVEWFEGLNSGVQASIITVVGGIVVAVIKGIFSLYTNRDDNRTQKMKSYTINQTSTGNDNTLIGVQINGEKENE